jgi:hypothetical protein
LKPVKERSIKPAIHLRRSRKQDLSLIQDVASNWIATERLTEIEDSDISEQIKMARKVDITASQNN